MSVPATPFSAAIHVLRTASLSQLRDLPTLETQILPCLGLNNEQIHQFPLSLRPYCTGSGLRYWQAPNQFAPYLAFLSQFDIDTYLEIGCRHGGTFILTCEYLNRLRPLRWAWANDLDASPLLAVYHEYYNRQFDHWMMSSQSQEFAQNVVGRRIDLALIDGDHSYDACLSDFNTIRTLSYNRIIVFHDIVNEECPGVVRLWTELKLHCGQDYLFHEFTNQYSGLSKSYFGLGVMVEKRYAEQAMRA